MKKENTLKYFLSKHIFSFYQEEPYHVAIKGPLKPTYRGAIEHQDQISAALIARLLERPAALHEMKNTLRMIGTEFASPLYIGMATNLMSRVNKHKALIEKYSEYGISSDNSNEQSDHDFASRVVNRGYVISNLCVNIKSIESENSLHNVMENILNRINYPILGRN